MLTYLCTSLLNFSFAIEVTPRETTWNSNPQKFIATIESPKATHIMEVPKSPKSDRSPPKAPLSPLSPNDNKHLKSILKKNQPGPIHKQKKSKDYKMILFFALCSASTIGMKNLFDNFFDTPSIVLNSVITDMDLISQDIEVGRPKFLPEDVLDVDFIEEEVLNEVPVTMKDFATNSVDELDHEALSVVDTNDENGLNMPQHETTEEDNHDSCNDEVQEAPISPQHANLMEEVGIGMSEEDESTSSFSQDSTTSVSRAQHVQLENTATETISLSEIDLSTQAQEDTPAQAQHDYIRNEDTNYDETEIMMNADQVLNEIDDSGSSMPDNVTPILPQHEEVEEEHLLKLENMNEEEHWVFKGTHKEFFDQVLQHVKKKIDILFKAILQRFGDAKEVTEPMWKKFSLKLKPAWVKIAPAWMKLQDKFSHLTDNLSQYLEEKMTAMADNY